MPTLQGSGTQAATIGTEHTLLDIAVPGTFVLFVDKTNMAVGDAVELRIKCVMLTGGSLKVPYERTLVDAPVGDDTIEISVPIPNDLSDSPSVRCTLKQIAGTGRNFDWKVLAL